MCIPNDSKFYYPSSCTWNGSNYGLIWSQYSLVATQQSNHYASPISIVSKLIIHREIQNRIYLMILTFLIHPAIVSAISMLTSIFSASFSSTEWRDASPVEQSLRSTTPISLNISTGYNKAFLMLRNSNSIICNLLQHPRVLKSFLGWISKPRPFLLLPRHCGWARPISLTHLF